MRHALTALMLLSATSLCHSAGRCFGNKKPKKRNAKRVESAPKTCSFVDLFEQLTALEQSAAHPTNTTTQTLKTMQQQVRARLHHIFDTLTQIAPKEASSVDAQLKQQLSPPNAKAFDRLFMLSVFIQTPTPDFRQALECLRLIKNIYDQENNDCEKARYLLCSKAFEKSIAALQTNSRHIEQRTESQHKRIEEIEKELLAIKIDAVMVKRCKEALFELAPGIFKKYNELARQVSENTQQLTRLRVNQKLSPSQGPASLSPLTQSRRSSEASLSSEEEFEMIEPGGTLP